MKRRSDADRSAEIAAMFAELDGSEELEQLIEEHVARTRAAKAERAADYWRYTVRLDPRRRAKKAAQSLAWRAVNAALVAAYNRSPKERARKAAYRKANRAAINRRARELPPERRAAIRALARIAWAGMTEAQRERIRQAKRERRQDCPETYRAKQKRWYDAHADGIRPKAAERMRARYYADPEAARQRQRDYLRSRQAAGLCRTCSSTAEQGRSRCRACLDEQAAKQRERRVGGRLHAAARETERQAG